MRKRIVLGVMLSILYIGALCIGPAARLVLFTVAAVVAVREFKGAFAAKGLRVYLAPAYVFAVLFAPVYYYLGCGFILPLWCVCVLAVMLERIFDSKRGTEECFAGLALFVYPLPFFALLMVIAGRFDGALGITATIAAAACPLLGDTLAYFVGGAIGRHKLCPAISPNKTLEGSVASVIGSVGGGALVYALQPVWGGHFPLAALLALGAVCGGLGQAGDLFASLIKRWAGLKDFGALIPGHGGVMDRLDSMLFCAPAVYYCFYFVAGGGIRT